MASGNKHLSALLAADLNRYFEHLVLTYQDQLYAFVLLRIRSRQAAQDLSEDSVLLDLQDQSLGPDEEVCRRESRRELELHVSQLPDLYRETMRLYYFNDLTCREIAERLNQPIGTVKANVHRGTQLLREGLDIDAKEMR